MNTRWLLLVGLLLLAFAAGQDEEGDGEGEGEGEDEYGDAEGEDEGDAESEGEDEGGEEEGDGEGEDEGGEEEGDAEGEGEDEGDADSEGGDGEDGDAEGDEEECEEIEDDGGSGNGTDIDSLLALGGDGGQKCKPKSKGDGNDTVSGSDLLAEAVGEQTCDKEGMDEKVSSCLEGLESKVSDLMNAIMGPEGDNVGSLEDKITLVLVKKGVISCENETQCDDNKQCLDQNDGMHRCQNPCERPEIIRCDVPYSECVTEEHEPACYCKEDFHGNGTDVCIPAGFETEENKRGYKMFDEEYVEWDNATAKCASLGARLPVLSDLATINIVKKYLETANFSVFEQWDRSSRRVWLGLQHDRASGLLWVDGQRIPSYPASTRLFVWESRRLLNQEVTYADSTRHYGFYIDGDIAKLPGGGRKGAAVLCELIPDQLAPEPGKENPGQQGGYGGQGGYGQGGQGGYGQGGQGGYGQPAPGGYGQGSQGRHGGQGGRPRSPSRGGSSSGYPQSWSGYPDTPNYNHG